MSSFFLSRLKTFPPLTQPPSFLSHSPGSNSTHILHLEAERGVADGWNNTRRKEIERFPIQTGKRWRPTTSPPLNYSAVLGRFLGRGVNMKVFHIPALNCSIAEMKWAAASSESQQSITGRHGHLLVPVMFVCAVAFLAPFDFGLSSKQINKWNEKKKHRLKTIRRERGRVRRFRLPTKQQQQEKQTLEQSYGISISS